MKTYGQKSQETPPMFENVSDADIDWGPVTQLCVLGLQKRTLKRTGEAQFPKGKWKSFSIPAKAKHCSRCMGRFRNVLFCSDFEKKMGTIRISPKKEESEPC